MGKQKQPIYRINLRPYRIFYWPFLLPVALILALFNKISPVPFKIYALRVDRVGQMSGNFEEMLCELDLGMHPREFRVYVHRDRPSNGVLLAMIKRVIPLHNAFLPLFDVCHKFGGLGVSSIEWLHITGRDPKQLVRKAPPHLSFTEAEEEEAKRQCRAVGIDPEKPFIPVLGRDNLYLKSIQEPTAHDSYRNVDINTFEPVMEMLAERFQVIRLGSVVKSKLNTNHPNVIDYALSGKRSELLDVYLSAKGHFFLSVGTGLDSIAALNFRGPVLYVNFIPLSITSELKPNCIIVPKKYWHVKEERYLKLSELIATGAHELYVPSSLNPMDIVVHDNTPQEIIEGAEEMLARLDNSWEETEEDIVLQEKYWSQYKKLLPEAVVAARIGAKFLRNNRYYTE